MTTRKQRRPSRAAAAVVLASACALLGAAGCATPGPLHVYTLPTAGAETIRDEGEGRTAEWPSYLAADESITGFAYDPYTDHFFLRLAPGDRIRVVDRPAKAIKREFTLPAAAPGGDLALRPLSGHLFLLNTRDGSIVETTRLGKFVRALSLENASELPRAIAYDAGHNHLLVLGGDGRDISIHELNGRRVRALRLEHAVEPSLAFDSVERRFHAPLAGAGGVGVFDEQGRWLRTEPLRARFVDVGPRSFLRVF